MKELRPPGRLAVRPGDVALSLQPPRDESLNGLLQGYRIYYRELESDAASAAAPKTLRTPSALRTELPGEPAAVPSSWHRGLAGHQGGRGIPEEHAASA